MRDLRTSWRRFVSTVAVIVAQASFASPTAPTPPATTAQGEARQATAAAKNATLAAFLTRDQQDCALFSTLPKLKQQFFALWATPAPQASKARQDEVTARVISFTAPIRSPPGSDQRRSALSIKLNSLSE
eukprot:TRINITY_DN94933_c0_g1_i1.p3 TRINITY_DN94933_c0_g1~~TRINITY_DN94933_c0_g1_i1.p3  ORF type:complete len:130 (+),score=15.87 TRINITY_DN94933_c0_g1_i1:434-823(+)